MTLLANTNNVPMKEHEGPKHHIAPHLRKNMLHVEFDEADIAVFKEIVGEDSVEGTMEVIMKAPSEVKVLISQIMKMIQEVA